MFLVEGAHFAAVLFPLRNLFFAYRRTTEVNEAEAYSVYHIYHTL